MRYTGSKPEGRAACCTHRCALLPSPSTKSIPLHALPSLRENQYHITHSFSNEHSSVIQVKVPVSTCQIKNIFLKMDVDLDNTALFQIGLSVLNIGTRYELSFGLGRY